MILQGAENPPASHDYLHTPRTFCDSVYIVSTEARCQSLAVSLQTRFVLGAGFSPPVPPPLAPNVALSPPPPSPPRPRIPAAIAATLTYVDPTSTYLSTYFLADGVDPPPPPNPPPPPGRRLDGGPGMGVALSTSERSSILSGLNGVEMGKWAACTLSLQSALLPCRSGVAASRCIDGARTCGSVDENGAAPYLELDFHDVAPEDKYLFAIDFHLPATEEYARLFFETVYGVWGQGYRVDLYDEGRVPLSYACLSWSEQSVGAYEAGLRTVQFRCMSSLATDAEYTEVARARLARLTLLGTLRHIWLDSVQLVFRPIPTLDETLPSPPPALLPLSPPLPSAPPDAPSPPSSPSSHSCIFHSRKS